MLRSIFIGLVSFVFGIVFLVTLSFFTVLTTFLSTDFYKDTAYYFHDSVTDWLGGDIYDRVPELQKIATRDQVMTAVKNTLTDEDFEKMMLPFVDQLLNPDFGEEGVAFVKVDFSPFFEKVSTFPEIVSKTVCGEGEGKCSSREAMEDKIDKIFNGMSLKTIKKDIPQNMKSFTLQIQKQNVEILPGTTVSKDLFWNVFWVLFAVNILLLAMIALITFRPWHRVLMAVAKPVMSGASIYALLFYGLYRAYIYFEPTIIKNVAEGTKTEVDVLTMSSAFVVQLLWLIVENVLVCSGVAFGVGLVLYMVGFFGKRYSLKNG